MRYSSFFSFSDMHKFVNTDRHRNLVHEFMPNSDEYPWVPTGPIEVKFERARIYRNAWFHSKLNRPDDSQTHQVRLYDAETDSYYFSDELNREVTAFFDNIDNIRTNNPVLEPQPVLGAIEEVADNFSDNLVGFLGSPLDQFAIHPYIPLHMGQFYLSFTNLSLFMLLTVGLVLLLFFVVTKKGGGKLVPNALQSLVELIYDFVLNLVNEQIGGLSGNVKQKFFPCILVTFTFLLFCNLQGMIPFSFTVTSHFLITLALSFSIFIGITIVGFQRHGLHFFSFLLPAGVPLPLAPFLVLLELISYCFRALSLGIRLFANMMAGHSLVKILSGFAWTMLFLNNIFYFIGDLGPLFIVLALTGLELGVAILQAYVFTILICIYLNDAINLH